MSADSKQKDWFTHSVAEVLRALQTRESGLPDVEVEARRQEYGCNALPERKAPGPVFVFLRQFASPLIYILVAAAIVSLAMGEWKDAVFIAAILVLNAIIGAYQEYQAEQTSQSLRQLLHFRATVLRSGQLLELDSIDVVPGDVVLLESGNRVPADLRLMESTDLKIDESLLTGESLPSSKQATAELPGSTPLAERTNMAFAGSLVSRGRGRAIVVETGQRTAVGKLAVALEDHDGKPPLLVRMERFTNFVAIATVSCSVVIGLIQFFLSGNSLFEAFFFVIALAVSAIPEGLPVAMTIALAVGTSRMAQRNVIVRRLAAVEGLGSCTLIATDKTGTLTCNELTVTALELASGERMCVTGEGFQPAGQIQFNGQQQGWGKNTGLDRFLTGIAVCNEGELKRGEDGDWNWRGDTVDVALLALAVKAELPLQELPRPMERLPYESEKQFAAAFVQAGQQSIQVFAKGAPERILEMSALSTEEQLVVLERAEAMAAEGLRVLAIATGTCSESRMRQSVESGVLKDLEYLGLVGMSDPLRPGTREAVKRCQDAGVKVMMVTGDHQVTATAIGKDLGLLDGSRRVMTGNELHEMSDQQLAACVDQVALFTRVTPDQKLRIVEAAQSFGHFVAVTGDGVNDAPALRTANIGVAMGRSGTDVAREAAELVIADDNFSSIVDGIEEGRIAYDNIRKVIFLLLSMGAAELLLVLLAVLTGLPLPLLPVQLLWLNLVTDGIQSVALAFEPGEGDSLGRPPRRPDEGIFNALMLQRIGLSVAVVGVGGFLVFLLALRNGYSVEHARNLLLLVMVLFENIHVGNSRSETKSAFRFSPFRSPVLLIGTVAAFLLHVFSMYFPPLQSVLATAPLSVGDWGIALAVALTVLPVVEWHKWWWNRKRTKPERF